MSVKILAINPGSTSSKIALFEGRELLFEKSLSHCGEQLAKFNDISEQFEFRKEIIVRSIEEWGVKLSDISIIMGRGGLVRPIPSGVYEVTDSLVADLKVGVSGKHASNLGGLIARSLADEIGAKAYIADPVVVDEMSEVAHISGCKHLPRKSIFHALNQKAIARDFAEEVGKNYEDLNLIIAHMGGGVSVAAHEKGVVVDVNNALSGDGPFSPERSGALVVGDMLELEKSGKYSEKELKLMISGEGGFKSHLGTSDVKSVVEKAQNGGEYETLIVEAFAYNVAKSIGAMATVFSGKVDAIILTGGIAYSSYICDKIRNRVEFIANVNIFAGEDEMKALAINGLMVFEGKIEPKKYC
ncbi:MAG: butyrate kinase [Rikenellaceae bacterium]